MIIAIIIKIWGYVLYIVIITKLENTIKRKKFLFLYER